LSRNTVLDVLGRVRGVTPTHAVIPTYAVTPAKAGVFRGKGARYHREIPAFAGMTGVVALPDVRVMTDVVAKTRKVATTGMDA